ncbi:non-ribosomal peptide synthetase [Pseudoalteromonas luteoviolacea]|uniref:non-ribosomal peptide synthetase n=1 Tax=Pseudoalteromonas luteoviolacea TaxID=43657 RepID=UPI00163C55E7|nr:non-ribosomal peptide synthetase [Pseudoalteromonas luteoviolacea]
MFISEFVDKKAIEINIKKSNNMNWEELEQYMEPAWLLLISMYENFPDDMTVFYSESGRLLSFNCKLELEKSIRDYLRCYRLLKQIPVDANESEMTSSLAAAYLISKRELVEIYGANVNNVKLSFFNFGGGIELIYNESYFDSENLMRLMEKFSKIVEALAGEQEQPLKSIFSELEYNEAKNIECFHRPPVLEKFESNVDIINSIEKIAKKFPDKTALVSETINISYEELLKTYNTVTSKLVSLGVGPGSRIGVCMQNRMNFIISILAVLKAGASFVPLDTKMPQGRIDHIVNDSNLKLVLIDDAATSKQFNTTSVEFSALLDNDQNANQELILLQEAEAYVIYTSGSTGLPKGVSISRRSLAYYTYTAVNEYQITHSDRALQFSSIAFDAMIEEVFPTLLAGATLVLQDRSSSNNINKILEFILKQQVTILNFPSSYWKELIRFNGLKEQLSESVRLVIIGGEAVYYEDLKIWQSNFHNAPELVNTYGPTETTVVTTTYHVPKNIHEVNCTIGRPIPGSKVYIVDGSGNIAPVGALGEIYIGGPGLAKGYLNKKVNRSFVELFSHDKSLGIFYKSGDYGRFLHDGNIEFVGRVDEQVKVGGYRVNLNEIKVVIDSFSSDISDVKVLNIKAENGRANKIVAMIESTTLKAQETLLGYLQAKLPHYMIPYIIILDKFPKTVSGKVDVKGLEKIYIDKTEYEYNDQLSAIENRVAKHWGEILKVPIKDKDMSFFEYGGNSVDTIHMLNKISSEFDIQIANKTFFNKKLSISNVADEISVLTGTSSLIKSINNAANFKGWRAEEARINLELYNYNTMTPKENCGLSVVITGSTGFLGIHLLQELMTNKAVSNIYCLVRGESEQSCIDRVVKASNENNLDVNVKSNKVKFIQSDITKKRLGLSKSLYSQLANSASAIIHCAAAVNIHLDYESLKKTNVDSVREIIDFAHTGMSKKIHYISSLAIFDCSPSLSTVNENTCIDSVNHLQGGYAQSKWVAEKLLMNARDCGMDVNIYRCGRIWGNLQSGKMPKNDFIWKFITGCIEVGYAPKIDITLDVTPACFMSKAIVDLVLSTSGSAGRNFHLANPNVIYLSDIYNHLNNENIPLEIIDYGSWLDDVLRDKCQKDPFHPLSSFEFILGNEDPNYWVDSYFRGKETEEALKLINLTYPVITSQVINNYLKSTGSLNTVEPVPELIE